MEPPTTPAPPVITVTDEAPLPASGVRRTMLAIAIVVAVGAAAYFLSGRAGNSGATNLVGLVGVGPMHVETILETSEPEEVEDVLRSEFGYRLRAPRIVGTEIAAVGYWDAGRSSRIPVVTYSDPLGDIQTALVMNYALLDRVSETVYLDRSIRIELEQDRSYAVVSTNDDREVVIWREGDDIFLAVAESGASRLIPRISQFGSGAQG